MPKVQIGKKKNKYICNLGSGFYFSVPHFWSGEFSFSFQRSYKLIGRWKCVCAKRLLFHAIKKKNHFRLVKKSESFCVSNIFCCRVGFFPCAMNIWLPWSILNFVSVKFTGRVLGSSFFQSEWICFIRNKEKHPNRLSTSLV